MLKPRCSALQDAASGGSAPATVASTKSAPAANSVAQKQSSRAASESAAATAGDSEVRNDSCAHSPGVDVHCALRDGSLALTRIDWGCTVGI